MTLRVHFTKPPSILPTPVSLVVVELRRAKWTLGGDA